ncbi:MAG: DUF6356 family protein [Rickettsiales bacterium]
MDADIAKKRARELYEQSRDWVMQEEHQRKAKEIKDQVEKAFTEHPQQTGETYLEHLKFTIKMTSRLFYTSVVLFTHGVFPFLFTREASLQIEKVYGIMKSRIPKKRLEEIDLTWDI